MPWNPQNPEGDENRTNAKEFNTVIKKLKGKKSIGPDRIPNEPRRLEKY